MSAASEAVGKPRATRHRYVETVPVVVKGGEPLAWAFMYECQDTGFRRPWGAVNRTIRMPGDPDAEPVPDDVESEDAP